jgi:hypothetical protein
VAHEQVILILPAWARLIHRVPESSQGLPTLISFILQPPRTTDPGSAADSSSTLWTWRPNCGTMCRDRKDPTARQGGSECALP